MTVRGRGVDTAPPGGGGAAGPQPQELHGGGRELRPWLQVWGQQRQRHEGDRWRERAFREASCCRTESCFGVRGRVAWHMERRAGG